MLLTADLEPAARPYASAPAPHASTAAAPLVAVRDLSIRFGGVTALDRVSFNIHAGEILGLIGPNGAGKTTLFNCLTRLYHATSGDIRIDGHSILRQGQHRL